MLEQEYLRPNTLLEALELMDEYKKDAKVLAGGTDLIINLREGMNSCKYLIDIKNIPEMRKLQYSDGNGLSIGGAVTLNEIIENSEVSENYPILIEAARTLANYLLRNRATMMGNICNASPAGDMLAPAIVLEGMIEAVSLAGKRYIALKDFFLGVKRNALRENELAVRIVFPKLKGTGHYMRKSRIKGHDLAQIGVAALLKDDGSLKIGVGAAAPVPVLVEDFGVITKLSLNSDKITEITNKVVKSINPIGDQRASKEYRLAMARYFTMKILESFAKEV